MNKKLLAVSILLFIAGADAVQAIEPQDCSMKMLASLDLAIGDHVLVPAMLADRKVWMTLDTASAFTFIRQSALADLRLHAENVSPKKFPIEIDGKSVAQLVSFGPFSLGSVRQPKRQLMVDPNRLASETVDGSLVVGTLGMDVLWPVDFELDLAQKRLRLYSQDHCSGYGARWAERYSRIPMDLSELGNVYFPIELDGRRIEASISVGNKTTTLTTDAARRLFGIDERSSAVEIQSDGDGHSNAYFRATKLTSGDLAITDLKITLVPAPGGDCKLSIANRPDHAVGFNGCFGRYPLKLGRDTIEKLRLYFATKEKVIYFAASDAAN